MPSKVPTWGFAGDPSRGVVTLQSCYVNNHASPAHRHDGGVEQWCLRKGGWGVGRVFAYSLAVVTGTRLKRGPIVRRGFGPRFQPAPQGVGSTVDSGNCACSRTWGAAFLEWKFLLSQHFFLKGIMCKVIHE